MNLFTEIQLQRAKALLDSLNEDLKPKERYEPIGVLTEIFQMDFQQTGEHFST